MLVRRFTEDFRLQERERGRRSLWHFYTAICGYTAEDEETGLPTVGRFHWDLCAFLEGRHPHHPWNRAVVCAARGLGKSVCARTYFLWRCLYIKNFSVLLISNSADNAKKLHFLPIVRLLTISRQSEYIRWIYADRFPEGLVGTTTEQLMLVSDDPNAEAAISYAGIETKLEGKHPDAVYIEDPEGADAEKGIYANEESWQCYQKVLPLPRNQARAQILLVATPWGSRPIVYRLRKQVGWKDDRDNATSSIKFFWRPILNGKGESEWPEKFPDWVIEGLRKDPMFQTQFMLREQGGEEGLFNLDEVDKALWRWGGPDRQTILYRGYYVDPDAVTTEGYVHPVAKETSVKLSKLRFYIHFDPLHRALMQRRSSMSKQRPARAAIAVVGVAPDGHVFLLRYTLLSEADLAGQANELFRLYCIYAPFKVTWESVGAQVWLKTYVQGQERQYESWQNPVSPGVVVPKMNLPRLSFRLVEATKTIQSKEQIYREFLGPWVNHGVLHLPMGKDGEIPRHQLANVFNEDEEVDLVDAIAQGPEVWKPPVGDDVVRDFDAARRRRYVESFVKREGWQRRTGFQGGWRRKT